MDIIQILPDSVANQIAAGEVIQRPASAVKELMENAIDAGAGQVILIVKDAGKTLIQVIDNGCGMSETDARMCFERHATSKIRKADDLSLIKTLGFRGEALASVAAIAQIEMKTKAREFELGTRIVVEATEVKIQEVCACADGTSLAVKNLFYNVPARRKFLKSNAAEMRHVVEEFIRIALIHPSVEFQLIHNDNVLYQLPPANLKQRVVNVFGNDYNKRLLPLNETTTVVKYGGFVGKPEFARKTRGEQYLFTNGRFIRHHYLHHAVENAYQGLLPKDAFPTYFITIDIDPGLIDVNIHPTKTEINFQESQLLYSILRSAIKKALGQYSVEEMDFEKDMALNFVNPPQGREISPPQISSDPNYNPFAQKDRSASSSFRKEHVPEQWKRLYEGLASTPEPQEQPETGIPYQEDGMKGDAEAVVAEDAFQVSNQYLVTKIRSGLVVIDQARAHQRILFEHFLGLFEGSSGPSQQQLFPVTVTLSPNDSAIMEEILEDIRKVGFDMEPFGKNSFIIRGAPIGLNNDNIKTFLEQSIECYKKNQDDLNLDKRVNLARSMAVNMSVKSGKKLQPAEIRELINRLFACDYPGMAPDGKPALIMLPIDELSQKFK